MATVRMTKRTCEPYTQESWDFVYEYSYCDRCGSFDLRVSSILPANIDRATSGAIPGIVWSARHSRGCCDLHVAFCFVYRPSGSGSFGGL